MMQLSSRVSPAAAPPAAARGRARCHAYRPRAAASAETGEQRIRVGSGLLASAAALAVLLSGPAQAEVRLPPIDTDPNRCERAFIGNTIGQANAVSDKLLDLRGCVYDGKSLAGKTLSGALMGNASFKKASMVEVVMSKAYAVDADFSDADFTNSVLDRVVFDRSSMRGANFRNSVITGSLFEGTDFTGASFEDANIGQEDAKRLCANPTVVNETRFSVGCRT